MVEAAQINDSIAAALLGDESDQPVISIRPAPRSHAPRPSHDKQFSVLKLHKPVQRPRTPSPPERRRLRELSEQAQTDSQSSISRLFHKADQPPSDFLGMKQKQHQKVSSSPSSFLGMKQRQHQKASSSKISSLLEKADRIVKPLYRAAGTSAPSAPATPAPSGSRTPHALPSRPKQPPGPPPGYKGSIAASATQPKPPSGPPPGFKPAASSTGIAKSRPLARPPSGVKASPPTGNAPQTPRQPGHPPPGVRKTVVSSSIPAPKTPPRQQPRPLQVTKIAKASISGRATTGRPQQRGLPPMPPTGAPPTPPAGVKRPRPPQGYSRLEASRTKARRFEEHTAQPEDDDCEDVEVEEDQLVEDAEFEQLRQQAMHKRAPAGNSSSQRPNGQQTSASAAKRVVAPDHSEVPILAGASAAGASEVGGKVQELIGKGVALDADALGALFGAPTGVACAVLSDLDNKKVSFANASKFVTTAVSRRTAVLASRSPRM